MTDPKTDSSLSLGVLLFYCCWSMEHISISRYASSFVIKKLHSLTGLIFKLGSHADLFRAENEDDEEEEASMNPAAAVVSCVPRVNKRV